MRKCRHCGFLLHLEHCRNEACPGKRWDSFEERISGIEFHREKPELTIRVWLDDEADAVFLNIVTRDSHFEGSLTVDPELDEADELRRGRAVALRIAAAMQVTSIPSDGEGPT